MGWAIIILLSNVGPNLQALKRWMQSDFNSILIFVWETSRLTCLLWLVSQICILYETKFES
jgi:hypothetical protein